MGGVTWQLVLDPPIGVWWLELGAAGRAWAGNSTFVWVSGDGLTWSEYELWGGAPGRTSGNTGSVLHNGEVWVFNRGARLLVRPDPSVSSDSWVRLKAGGEHQGRALVVDFGRGEPRVETPPLGSGRAVACAGARCAAVFGGEIALRDAPGQQWRSLGAAPDFVKWYVDNCAVSGLKRVAEIFGGEGGLYSVSRLAYDGDTVAGAASVSMDNTVYYAMGFVAGVEGIRAFPFGYAGAWARAPGEFWFFGAGVERVVVGREASERD